MHNYAQVDDEGFVIGVSSLTGVVDMANMIPIGSYDESLIGKHYNTETGEFE